ncbi:hypothetical protein [Paenibacillus agricola]|uniref:Tissue inhibitor of metalloproteinase n=1 Tax=Paenibacillus agricola TaxID=2716264 RepID=A0ABX0JDK1_9BACL|nr:hypothetical protein [Paenibacillus agricola]NHN34514.1 hypothetical protein [Paenibacillus agricola]
MRKIINLVLLYCLVLSIMTIFIPSTVYGCSCAQPQTVEAELNRSEAVFAGRVLEVKEQRNLNGSMTKAALFEVSHIWKGGSESQIIIHTGSGGGDCGFRFEEGKDYLVYAHPSTMYGDKELLITIICDRTNVLVQVQEDLAILGDGKVPTEQVNLEGELYRIDPYVWVTVIGIAVIGMMIFFVWRKVRR